MKTPISLIIDDPSPISFVYYHHNPTHATRDGRPLPDKVPLSFMEAFCATAKSRGLAGKFSIVPVPGGIGRIDRSLPGIPDADIRAWLKLANDNLAPKFDFCPEICTHHQAWDITNEKMLDIREDDWGAKQSAETLTDYIAYALTILKNAGIDCTGVTSPWQFGEYNERDYATAIGRAMQRVTGRNECWYFLFSKCDVPGARPWVSVEEEGRRVIAIPGTIDDGIWETMDTTDTSDEYVSSIADKYITADGKSGKIINALSIDAFPILTTHWQSLFSAGNGTGLRALNLIAERVEKHLCNKVEWTSFSDLMKYARG